MHIRNRTLLGLTVGMPLLLAGCPADDTDLDSDSGSGTESGSDTDQTASESQSTSETAGTDSASGTSEGSTGGGPSTCPGEGAGDAAEGESCASNGDCMSGLCLLFNDVPTDPDATCGPVPEGCATRATGTLKDFSTGEPISGTDVNLLKALDAITNPGGATPLASATSDGEGKIDMTTDGQVSSPIGIIAVAGGGDFYLTATGVSAPNDDGDYTVGTGIHEFWAVPNQALTDWTAELMGDAEIAADQLPLGDAGGIVGLVRDGTTGDPVAGAVVQSASDTSPAIVRYLQEDGSFTADMTSATGIFVVVNPAAPSDDFEAFVGGESVAGGTAGSTDGAVFTLVLNAG